MNAVSGALSIFFSMYGCLLEAALFIILGMVFDFFDGLVARLLHVKSDLGKELDSLADVISFGLAPAVLVHFLMLEDLPGNHISHFAEWHLALKITLFSPLLIPAFSAYRLAKFNLDSRQTTSFIGLPTPANALFWVTLVWSSVYIPESYREIFGNIYVLGISVVILSVLLVSELPMFSLKISNFRWQGNEIRYIYFTLLLGLAVILGKIVIMLTIPLYILLSVAEALRRTLTTLNR